MTGRASRLVVSSALGCSHAMKRASPNPPTQRYLYKNSPNDDAQNSDNLVWPESSSSHHHNDLISFRDHATRSGLDPKSTTYVGTHYEYTVKSSLTKYGFRLIRVGRSSDCGIDLLGTWTPFPRPAHPQASSASSAAAASSSSLTREPQTHDTLRVILQCKAGLKNTGPQHIRELEGAFVGAPPGWSKGPWLMGLLAAQQPATKGMREALQRSKWPMGFICCSAEGAVKQLLWNERAAAEGLEEFVAVARHTGVNDEMELVLTLNGVPVPEVHDCPP